MILFIELSQAALCCHYLIVKCDSNFSLNYLKRVLSAKFCLLRLLPSNVKHQLRKKFNNRDGIKIAFHSLSCFRSLIEILLSMVSDGEKLSGNIIHHLVVLLKLRANFQATDLCRLDDIADHFLLKIFSLMVQVR